MIYVHQTTNILVPSNRLVMKYQALVPKIVFKIDNGFQKMDLNLQFKETYLTNSLKLSAGYNKRPFFIDNVCCVEND